MPNTEPNTRHLEVEDLEEVVGMVVGCIRDSRLGDAVDYVLRYSNSLQIQSACGKTDHKKLARVDSAIKKLRATVRVRMQAESATTNATINHVVSPLRRVRNALVNINTFPEELLRSIFVWFSGADVAEKTAIANTCLRWREVCLAFPDLWADFTAADGMCGLIDKALSRSRGLPLTVSASYFDHHWPAVVLALGLHGDAIQSLSLCSESCGALNKIFGWQTSFPCLRELRLTSQPLTGLIGMLDVEVLSGALHAGQLETMVLTNCRWPYAPDSYRGIKSLSLVCNTGTDDDIEHFLRWSRRGLCDALSGSPLLEDLTLHHPFMHFEEVLAENQLLPPVSLRSLRSLRVCMTVEKASALLSRLHTSADELETVVLILTPWRKLPGSRRPKPDRETLLFLPRPESLPMLTRLGSLSLSDGYRIFGARSETLPEIEDWDELVPDVPRCPPGLYIHFDASDWRWSLMEKAFDNFLASILEHYVLDGLRTLRVRRFWDPEQVMSILRITPCIHTLILATHTQPDKVLQAIVDRREEGRGGSELFLPELRVVRLTEGDVQVDSNVLPGLRAAVKRLGLRCLSFEGCRTWLSESELAEQFQGDCAGLEVRCIDLIKAQKPEPSWFAYWIESCSDP
ncbi:hypothetical protein LXA43DRAFT_511405 [Ganoderma leucocontextum]|nr:hypothetical protein LXA43DRAFT_511405 [Ganoderma leucocontextum]